VPVLHLGVNDIPYVNAPRKGQNKPTADTKTTGDVGEILEAKYHVMEIFANVHEADIVSDLESGLAGALENLLMGAPPSTDPFGAAASKIEGRMKDFITNREMDALGYPGVPTQAALDRAAGKARSSRKSKKRKSNAEAVSFYDSGLYQSSMKAWVD
jgi:hypothetical protein